VLTQLRRADPVEQLAADVRAGLGEPGQKTLPSKYLYDPIGSALFDAIALLPEYGLTAADERLLRGHAGEVAALVGAQGRLHVAELGSGSGRKTRPLLAALAAHRPVVYRAIDISPAALERTARELAGLEPVECAGIEAEYLDGLAEVTAERAGERALVLWLGSSIGNYGRAEADALLRAIRDPLRPGDALLLSADLVKPVERLLAAYDDPAGLTAAFDRNLLARLNRELGADFDPRRFDHRAVWNAAERRIEMHLRACVDQRVEIPRARLRVTLAAGETIWTESAHKFTAPEVRMAVRRAGFGCAGQWLDAEWPFAVTLAVAS
jgi:dimethylhistidine N-methyltransferase